MPFHQIVPSPSSALLLGVGLQFAVQLLDKIWQNTLDWPKITKNIALTFIKPNFLRKYESCCFSIKNFPIPKKHHSVRGCQVCISRYVQHVVGKIYLYVQSVLHKTYVTLYTVCVCMAQQCNRLTRKWGFQPGVAAWFSKNSHQFKG